MGSGKTTWCINEMLNKNYNENILYITPYLAEIERIKEQSSRKIYSPENKGKGKIGNIADLINNQMDIASTHELFRRFDNNCKKALQENEYTLILDETLTAVEPYHFTGKDDYKYLLANHDIEVDNNGLIKWTGGNELNTRFDDVRILAENKCLFKVDEKFFLWHFPIEVFRLFKRVYIMTYMFSGSIMKYYFDLYQMDYDIKSIKEDNGIYILCEYFPPNIQRYSERITIYEGKLTDNISQKETMLSANWCKSQYNQKELVRLKNNFYNFARNICKASGDKVMWTCHKNNKKKLSGKGYTKGFVACNARATNEYQNATCLMYGLNWFDNPEIVKFFKQNGIEVNQEKTALSTLLQWIWRSNIRVPGSKETINIYIPSRRMRNLLKEWIGT